MSDSLDHFKTASAAARWISEQGYVGQRGVISERQARKEIGRLRRGAEGYPFAVVKKLADKTWGGKVDHIGEATEMLPTQGLLDSKERLLAAQASLQEYKLKELKGQLIDVAEEARRDAAVISGIRQQLAVSVPETIIALVADLKAQFPAEQHGTLSAIIPELIEAQQERLADIFNELAEQGGINESI